MSRHRTPRVAPPIEPRRGQVWFARIPGQPDDPHQPRPALIVSDDVRNAVRDDVILVPARSRGGLGPTRVALDEGAGGIPHSSVLFCEDVTTVNRSFLERGPLGDSVDGAVLAAVVRAIRRAIGDVVLEPSLH